MNTMIKRSIGAFALSIAFTTTSLPVQAGESAATGESNIKVKFRDLDLSKPEGVAALYQRIERSARLVCTDSSSPWDAGRVETFKRCYQGAIEDAVSSINQPQLTALHQSKTTKPVQVGAASR
jgi:UrcA family protein